MRADAPQSSGPMRGWRIVGIVAAVILVLSFVVAWASGAFPDVDRETVEAWVDQTGPWGPLAVIALMTVAVVASPIPSAPIALASGAAYGHYAGTVYVAIGAEAGALTAFLITRSLGRGPSRRSSATRPTTGFSGRRTRSR